MTYDKVLIEVLPAARAIIAKKMISSGMNQKDIAEKLRITQPAVSQYKRDTRGHAAIFDEKPELREAIEKIAEKVANGELNIDDATGEIIDLCRNV
ncbi:MAG: transcriptional regulator [Candidatus Aenigmarchaeota archaeon]|nr:transcriptional regulator [Candidatus Aenigmarchaeota archaeon]